MLPWVDSVVENMQAWHQKDLGFPSHTTYHMWPWVNFWNSFSAYQMLSVSQRSIRQGVTDIKVRWYWWIYLIYTCSHPLWSSELPKCHTYNLIALSSSTFISLFTYLSWHSYLASCNFPVHYTDPQMKFNPFFLIFPKHVWPCPLMQNLSMPSPCLFIYNIHIYSYVMYFYIIKH